MLKTALLLGTVAFAWGAGLVACDPAVDEGAARPTPRDVSEPTGGGASIDADAADPSECIESVPGPDGYVVARRIRLDADAGLVTAAFEGDSPQTLAWRYDEARRVIRYIGKSPQQQFQHDTTYDPQGNTLEFVFTYPEVAQLDTASTAAVYLGRHHANRYDDAGALTESTRTHHGATASSYATETVTYHENALRQCDRIETRRATESTALVATLAYDAQGRLARTDVTRPSPSIECSSHTTTTLLTYDDSGRLVRQQMWCNGTGTDVPADRDTRTTFRPDGTQRVELEDRISDTRRGTSITERSAACSVLDAWRTQPTPPSPSAPCRD